MDEMEGLDEWEHQRDRVRFLPKEQRIAALEQIVQDLLDIGERHWAMWQDIMEHLEPPPTQEYLDQWALDLEEEEEDTW